MNEPVAYVNSMCNDYIDWKIDPMSIDGQPLYTHPAKTLTDEEITIVKEAVGNYVCTIKMEIDQQKQTFKGYEHCSNLPALKSELKDAEQALAILKKASEE